MGFLRVTAPRAPRDVEGFKRGLRGPVEKSHARFFLGLVEPSRSNVAILYTSHKLKEAGRDISSPSIWTKNSIKHTAHLLIWILSQLQHRQAGRNDV